MSFLKPEYSCEGEGGRIGEFPTTTRASLSPSLFFQTIVISRQEGDPRPSLGAALKPQRWLSCFQSPSCWRCSSNRPHSRPVRETCLLSGQKLCSKEACSLFICHYPCGSFQEKHGGRGSRLNSSFLHSGPWFPVVLGVLHILAVGQVFSGEKKAVFILKNLPQANNFLTA